MARIAADDVSFDEPCILFALRREAAPFLQEFRPQQRLSAGPCWAQFCGPAWLNVLVLRTGMGKANVERALAWLETEPPFGGVPCRPRLILSAGFAGGLSDQLRVGDLVVATEVCDENGACLPALWPGELTGEWRPVPHRGRMLTTAAPVSRSEDKLALGVKFGALAVDMESAIVARWCQRRQLPFGAIRVVSDDVYTNLSPRLQSLLAAGEPSISRVLAAVIQSPKLLPELLRLAKQTREAGRVLGKALGELLTLTLPFGADL